jgi:hypothetical protein
MSTEVLSADEVEAWLNGRYRESPLLAQRFVALAASHEAQRAEVSRLREALGATTEWAEYLRDIYAVEWAPGNDTVMLDAIAAARAALAAPVPQEDPG